VYLFSICFSFRQSFYINSGTGVQAVKVHRIDHVGIIVKDLAAAKVFFLDFGLELQGEGELSHGRQAFLVS
jgi:catechol-2,3-dioxygenase